VASVRAFAVWACETMYRSRQREGRLSEAMEGKGRKASHRTTSQARSASRINMRGNGHGSSVTARVDDASIVSGVMSVDGDKDGVSALHVYCLASSFFGSALPGPRILSARRAHKPSQTPP